MAYSIAKCNRPFVDLPEIVDLQTANDTDLGRILHSNVTCAKIINHIATHFRKGICRSIVASSSEISVLIDEGTSAGN